MYLNLTMSLILDLPGELLLLIFENLNDLDDVLHLGRASHHQYDIQLCYLIEVNQRYTSNYLTFQEEPPTSCRPTGQSLSKSFQVLTSDLQDEFVWSISTRWQGLQLLRDLYRHPAIQSAYFCSSLHYRDDFLSNQNTEMLQWEGSLPHLEANSPGVSLVPFDARQTQRFHQSLSAQWLAIEALCLWRVSVFQTSQEKLQVFEKILKIWTDNPHREVSETMDILEIFDFVWGFLLRRIFGDVTDLSSWLPPLDLNLSIHFILHDLEESWKWDAFIRFLLPHMRPSNIIELLVLRTWNPSLSWPPDKPNFLRQLGFFDTWDGICLVNDVHFPYDTYIAPSLVENDVLRRLKQYGSSSDIIEVWKVYRDEAWIKDARGKVLSWDEDQGWIIKQIMTALEEIRSG
ncbi:conserved hypothetical protein [Histoplasma capsulatum G186AR]|uniref:F-box domain-containing protein n=1 Tax=Ajellomyces capsulatus (strain G186AR / H82 / ATCC MYA-2454 / RMSCC 2432) TaxID=447093 RepID=C0NVV1_AJECG|nr:uncharacterized protein HCBG_07281 [Histoplasma capsulatum G186AR]EEH04640.1 conserved hypothetical protein [Histoplasma capsulatum G186AR]